MRTALSIFVIFVAFYIPGKMQMNRKEAEQDAFERKVASDGAKRAWLTHEGPEPYVLARDKASLEYLQNYRLTYPTHGDELERLVDNVNLMRVEQSDGKEVEVLETLGTMTRVRLMDGTGANDSGWWAENEHVSKSFPDWAWHSSGGYTSATGRSRGTGGSVFVHSYTRSDGTHVRSHTRRR